MKPTFVFVTLALVVALSTAPSQAFQDVAAVKARSRIRTTLFDCQSMVDRSKQGVCNPSCPTDKVIKSAAGCGSGTKCCQHAERPVVIGPFEDLSQKVKTAVDKMTACGKIDGGRAKLVDEKGELDAFANCYCKPKSKITAPSGAEYTFTGEGQLTQGGFKRLFLGKVTKQKTAPTPSDPANNGKVIIAANKIVLDKDAIGQCEKEYTSYTDHAAAMACPHVMRIHDGWKDKNGKIFWTIMEYIEGKDGSGNLQKWFSEKNKKFNLKEWGAFAKQMFECWGCLLKNGVQIDDADLKNMMIDKSGNYKLIDLDISAIGGDEAKVRNFALSSALKVGGAKRKEAGKNCFNSWNPAYGGSVAYHPECGGVISKATAPQKVAIAKVFSDAVGGLDSAGKGLTEAAKAAVLVDGTLSTAVVDDYQKI